MRWTGTEYDRLVQQGHLDHRRVELVNGEILEMSPMSDQHAQGIQLTHYALLSALGLDAYTIQIRCPMRFGERSRPEPDVAVIAGTAREVKAHPSTALLVIEVSDSTLAYDREVKAPLYAAEAIADYWIVNLADRCVEVHRRPMPDAVSPDGFRYGDVRVFTAGESIAPLAMPAATIAVDDLLP
jgi:Uma2 family endonuclease